jgi:hypothetical protein
VTRLPLLRALARSFTRYCARVERRRLTTKYLVNELAARRRKEPFNLFNGPWIDVGAAMYQFGGR